MPRALLLMCALWAVLWAAGPATAATARATASVTLIESVVAIDAPALWQAEGLTVSGTSVYDVRIREAAEALEVLVEFN